jgi:nucleotide-binding universal stress UspA family protein
MEDNMTADTDTIERVEHGDVVVGIDDSVSSRMALDWAAKWARSTGARLRAVHVLDFAASSPLVWTSQFPAMAYVPDIPTRANAEEAMSALFHAAAPEPDWTLEIRDGIVGRELVSAARTAQLLVVGTREHVGPGRLISGSVSHYCVTHAGCPVAAVPPTADQHPVAQAANQDLAVAAATGSTP